MPTQTQIVTAATFYFKCDAVPNGCPISELKNINSQVEPVEYIYSDSSGNGTVHTRQYGKTKPPNVTFVTGLDPTSMKALFTWHELARNGDPNGRYDTEIYLGDAAGSFTLTYLLESAWCSKLEIGGAKAGSTDSVTVTVTLECDSIACK